MEGIKYKWTASFSEHFRYKFHTGMVAWAIHRITGIGLTIFIAIHIWSISHLGSGPESFNATMALYSTPLFKIGEVMLFAVIIFHAMNGLRIIWVDFFGGAKYHKKLFWALMVAAMVLFIMGIVATFLPMINLINL